MKKTWSMIVMLAVGIVLVTAVLAQAWHRPSPAGMSPRAFIGNVVSVDTSSMMLVVKSSHNEKTFDVSSAKYSGGARLQNLKKGDRITVEYVGKYGKYSAMHIARVPQKTTKAKTGSSR